jgi:TfoX/Sxy family transcriptional regulator of competence genes
LLGGENLSEKKMFGGLAFLTNGHMAVAVSGQGGIMVRVDPAETDALLNEPGAGPFEMHGRPMKGWLRVDAAALDDDAVLRGWAERGLAYARTLPPK